MSYLLSACSPPLDIHSTRAATTSFLPTLPSQSNAKPGILLTPTTPFYANDKPSLKYNSWDLVHDINYSPDGKLLAVSAGEKVYIYEADSLTLRFILSPGAWTNRLAFHPTGPLIALAVRDGSIQFWDTVKGTLICQFTAHKKGANSLAIHPGGTKLATTGTDITSRLWDISSVAAGNCNVSEIGGLIGESYSSPEVTFSPDGKLIALVDRTNLRLRNSENRKLIALLKGDLPIFDIAFSPDGRWLTIAEHQDTVALWDISKPSKPKLSVLALVDSNPKDHIWRVAFSPDSRLLAAGASDGSLKVWDITMMQLISTYQFPRAVTALAFSPDGKQLAAGGLDAQVWILSSP